MANLHCLMILAAVALCLSSAMAQRRGMGGMMGRRPGGRFPGFGGNRGPGFGRRPNRGGNQEEDDDRCPAENEMFFECPDNGEQVKAELTCEMAQKMYEMKKDAEANGEEFVKPEPEMVDCVEQCRCKKFEVRMGDDCVSMKECLGEDWEPEKEKRRPWGNMMGGQNRQNQPPRRRRPWGSMGKPNEDDDRCPAENEMFFECPAGDRQVKAELTCEMAQQLYEMKTAAKENGEDFVEPEPEMVDCVEQCRCKKFQVRMGDDCVPMKECLGEDWEPEKRRPWGNMMGGQNQAPKRRPWAGLGKPNEDDDRCPADNEMFFECPAEGEQVQLELTCEMAQKLAEMRKTAMENGEDFVEPEPEMVDCVDQCRCKKFQVRQGDDCIPMKECLGVPKKKPAQNRWQRLRNGMRNIFNRNRGN